MKPLKVEAVFPMAYETFDDVAADLPRFIDQVYNISPIALRGRLSQPATVQGHHARLMVKTAA